MNNLLILLVLELALASYRRSLDVGGSFSASVL